MRALTIVFRIAIPVAVLVSFGERAAADAEVTSFIVAPGTESFDGVRADSLVTAFPGRTAGVPILRSVPRGLPRQKFPRSTGDPQGRWSRLGYADPEPRDSPSLVYDPIRKRLILFGGFDGSEYHNDTWERPADGETEWQRLPLEGRLPPGRSRHVAVFDSIADAMVVYGGQDANHYLGDIWTLDLKGGTGWRELEQADEPRPVPRGGCVGVLETTRHRLVIAAGATDLTVLNDVWGFDLDTGHWATMVPQAVEALARSHLALAYDSRRQRWLGFGGEGYNDLLSWDMARGNGWSKLDYADQGPVGLGDPCAVYDSLRDQLIVLGGSADPDFAMELSVIDLARQTRGAPRHVPGEQPPPLHGAAAVYDPLHDRVLVFGGATESAVMGDLWQLSLGDSMHWTRLAGPGSGAPSPREYASSVYDPVHRRWVILFGWDGSKPLRDIWNYDFESGRWSQNLFADYGFPAPGLYGVATAYDPIHNRVLLFGGSDGVNWLQNAWQFEMAPEPDRLSPLAVIGDWPRKRAFASAFYDPSLDAMRMFGGQPEGGGSSYGDQWIMRTMDFHATWQRWVAPDATPKPHAFGSGIYDPIGDRLVEVGGWQDAHTLLPRVWSIGLADSIPHWSHYGTGIEAYGGVAGYDAGRQQMVIFGGNLGSERTNTVWDVPLADEPILPASPAGPTPAPRYLHAAATDPHGHRMFVYGGAAYLSTNRDLFGDLWELDFDGAGAWHRLLASPPFPEQRSTHAALYDAARDRMLLFGGGTLDDSVWVLPLGGALRWSKLATQGPSPGWRAGPGIVYDARRDRAIVLGGSQGPTSPLKDAWALTLSEPPTWSLIVPRDTLPEGGENSSCVYDSLRDRIVDFGGDVTFQRRRFDYWRFRPGAFALSLADPTWSRLDVVGGPAGNRTNQAAALERSGTTILSFGGVDDQVDGTVCDTWAIALDSTRFAYQSVDACTGPAAANSPTIVRDPDHQTLLLNEGNPSTVWIRPDDGSGAWQQVAVGDTIPEPRIESSVVFDTRRGRMLMWGGNIGPVNCIALWAFTPGSPPYPRPRPRPPNSQFALRTSSPARGCVGVAFTLRDREPAQLELYDIAGRRVASHDVGNLGAGEHRLQLAETTGLAPGIYLVRLRRVDEISTSRVVLLK